MKIAYFGLPLGALLLLQDGHTLGRAILSPISAPGRRRLHARLGARRVLEAAALTSAAIEDQLRQDRPDLIVSWFFTRLIEPRWLALAKHGGIGAHPSLLPRHRGPNPFFWSIDQGDRETGVSIHRLSAEYDTGAVLAQQRLLIEDRDAWQLARALDRPALRLLREVVRKLAQGVQLSDAAQQESDATWAAEPTGDLLGVDWSWPTERVVRRIRALSPVPGLALEVCGVRFFVTHVREISLPPIALEPGEAALLRHELGPLPVLRTVDGALAIERACIGLNDDELAANEGDLCTAQELAQLLLRAQPHMIDSVLEPPP